MSERTYSELIKYPTLEERFRYLNLRGRVGEATFGFDRYLNQDFYRSQEWRLVRREVVVRDNGCDLGVAEWPIRGNILVHHMNPMRVEDIVDGDASILDPEFLISVSLKTHNAIHYGDEAQLPRRFAPRRPGDTVLWERIKR